MQFVKRQFCNLANIEHKYYTSGMKRHGYRTGITSRSRIIEFIQGYQGENGVSPTMREIAQGTGLSLTNVHHHLRRLRESRAVDFDDYKWRGVVVKV